MSSLDLENSLDAPKAEVVSGPHGTHEQLIRAGVPAAYCRNMHMRRGNLVQCSRCGRMVSRDAETCPRCGIEPAWDPGVQCAICRRVVVSQHDRREFNDGYYHNQCISRLFRVRRGLKCPDCGFLLDTLYSQDWALRTSSRACPNCGAPDTLQKFVFDCPWCGLPIFERVQRTRLVRCNLEHNLYHSLCARKQRLMSIVRALQWINWPLRTPSRH